MEVSVRVWELVLIPDILAYYYGLRSADPPGEELLGCGQAGSHTLFHETKSMGCLGHSSVSSTAEIAAR